MKNILYVSPSFSAEGTIYKHNLLFFEAVSEDYNIHLATGKKAFEVNFDSQPVLSYELPMDLINAVVNRIFPNRVFYGSDPFKQPRIPFLQKKCEQFIDNNGIDVIHTVCRPYYAHKLGYNLKKKYGIPWVAQFLDAWLDNPDRTVPRYLEKYDLEQEAMVAHNADVILHTNKQLIDIWNERYGDVVRDKMFVMPFCYNHTQIDSAKSICMTKRKENVINLSYVGISMGNRNLQDVIEASHILLQNNPQLRGRFQINIIGNYLISDSSLVAKYGLNDTIIHKGYLRGQDLLNAYLASDVFIVIDSPMERNVFFPSKLLDYFYYQKPILGITSKCGVTHDLLVEAGHFVVENGAINELVKYLSRLIEDFNSVMSFNREYYKIFSPEKVRSVYSNIIDCL